VAANIQGGRTFRSASIDGGEPPLWVNGTKSLRDSRFAGGLGGDLIKLTHSAPREGE
jgi:hypothetical protein